jgi:hypothetical protein
MVEGQQDAADRFRVQLRQITGALGSVSAGGVNAIGVVPNGSAEGTFRFDNLLPGDYRVGFSAASMFAPMPEYYIKEARLEQTDVLSQPLQIGERISAGATLTLVLSPNVGQVEGSVINDQQQPVAGVQAVLIPDSARDRADLYKAATTDQYGRFTIRAVAPGDYKLFAWEILETFGYFDAELVKKSEAFGVAVRVRESSRVQADVKAIPAGRP